MCLLSLPLKSFAIQGDEVQKISPLYRVCTLTDNLPHDHFEDAKYQGLNSEFLAAITNTENSSWLVVPVDNIQQSIDAVTKNECDLSILTTMNNEFHFGNVERLPIIQYPLAAAMLPDTDVDTALSPGSHLTVEQGLFDYIKHNYPTNIVLEVANSSLGLAMVATDKSTVFISSLPSLVYQVSQLNHKNIKVVEILEQPTTVELIVNSENISLVRQMRDQISILTNSDKQTIVNDWFPLELINLESKNHSVLILASVLGLLLLLAFYIRFQKMYINLKKQLGEQIKSNNVLEADIVSREKKDSQSIKFAQMISHEYRTPVSVISANIDILEILNGKSSLGLNRHLTKMRTAVDNLVALVETSLAREDLISNKLIAHKIEFDFLQALNETLTEVRVNYRHHLITVDTETSEISMAGDVNLIKLLIKNLVENSCKYSPVEEPIFISINVLNQTLTLHIVDKGIGIPSIDLDSIFDKYHRASNTANTSGIGVGLYLSKLIVTQHQGKLEVISSSGGGTEVSVTLPL